MNYGFVRTATVTPSLRVADCPYNGKQIMQAMDEACSQHVDLLVFPELSVTGYTCADLFLQQELIESASHTLMQIVRHSNGMQMVSLVGLPVAYQGKLFNCAAAIFDGRLLGLVPKTHLPNYQEFYERRWFTPGDSNIQEVQVAGQLTVMSTSLLFSCATMPEFCIGVEICEDLWVPAPPSVQLASRGATIIANLSASDETVGKEQYRRDLVVGQSGRLVCAYIYCDAGEGESTTDMVFTGNDLICENGTCLGSLSMQSDTLLVRDVDVQSIVLERRKMTTFVSDLREEDEYVHIPFDMDISHSTLRRFVDPHPFVPVSETDREERCKSILTLQALGLKTRLAHAHAQGCVVGLSGGLDSTLALLVTVQAADMLGWERSRIVAVTMPGFGTTVRTKGNAEVLAEALGVTLRTVDISNAVLQHFADIGHDKHVQDVTYENSQARERTQILMDIANSTGSLVIGTGDLSELALGWATYNGDHMSMYGVNASIPKTLVRYLVQYVADMSDAKLQHVLLDILDTPVSPELLPASGDGTISQVTENIVGPYVLHDFFLYQVVRRGFAPAKVLYLALAAFNGKYEPAVVLKWLRTFYRRFFSQQFKRSCLPDGPKVGTVTLSPRGDWRMPSDASSVVWTNALEVAAREFGIE